MSSRAPATGRRCSRRAAAASAEEVRSRTCRVSATSSGAAGPCATVHGCYHGLLQFRQAPAIEAASPETMNDN